MKICVSRFTPVETEALANQRAQEVCAFVEPPQGTLTRRLILALSPRHRSPAETAWDMAPYAEEALRGCGVEALE